MLVAWIVSHTGKLALVRKMVVGLPHRWQRSPHIVRRIPTVVNESSLMARLPIGFLAR
jgi:hypothetical protein